MVRYSRLASGDKSEHPGQFSFDECVLPFTLRRDRMRKDVTSCYRIKIAADSTLSTEAPETLSHTVLHFVPAICHSAVCHLP